MELRKPIVAIMGHVDHGKTRILDSIRNTTVIEREAGAITQAIGASIIPVSTIKRICGPLMEKLKTELNLPGLLFIDTPGHAAFTNLRRRGGSLADIAILVIDINEGLKPQTIEALEILKKCKTPFIIAANKIDLVSGWKLNDTALIESINNQSKETQQLLDAKLYELVGGLSEHGFNAERFDRVDDYTKKIVMVPTCAKTSEGIPELLMLLTGLGQRFLNKCLECNTEGQGVGTILEVKEEQGLGKTIDVIIYNGKVMLNDIIVIGNIDKPIVTKVKALLEPRELCEMMDKKSQFCSAKCVSAATGVKIVAKDIDNAIAGMPLRVATSDNLENVKVEIQEEIDEVLIETDNNGIIVKADSLGSLEAMITLLKERKIPLRKATVGSITKKDITDAQSNIEEDPLTAVVLGFNVSMLPDAETQHKTADVKVFTNKVIYRLLEDFEKWIENEKKKSEQEKLDLVTKPFRLEILKGYIFRQNNPAVFGVDIIEGTLKTTARLLKADGARLPPVKSIKLEKDNLEKAEKGKQVAISVDGITIGRQVNEGDTLYSDFNEEEFRKLKELKALLTKDEIELIKEIADIKRKENPLWGV